MADRRRAPRYQFYRSARAEVSLAQDVVIQSVAGDHVVVLASACPVDCDRLLVQISDVGDDHVTSFDATVLASAPVVHNGVVQFHVALRVNGFGDLARVNPLATLA